MITILLLLLLSLFGFATSSNTELDTILNLKASLNISTSTPGFQSWTSQANSPCTFSGISCDSNGSITQINLYNTSISGTIPFDSLCYLPSLTNLTLSSNSLFSTLTPDIRNCTQLQSLDLSFNRLYGQIPDISPLNNLQVLKLNSNSFTGVFPWSSLSNLTRLEVLLLGDNLQFDESPFPEIVTNLTQLNVLYLSDSNLKGEIPASIGNMTNLVDLEFADNFIYGEIPEGITNLKNLMQLEIYNNSLAGKFPPGFGNLTNLAYLDASMNNLEGDLSELRSLTNLFSLQLFFNNFVGEIPTEFGDFISIVNLSLFGNSLTGSIPTNLGSRSQFNYIDVSANYLTGEIPPNMCKMGTMKKLLVIQNRLTGEIPASYANCSSLVRLRVSNNSLSGTVPVGIWRLPNIDYIDLSLNQFEGPIDSSIGEAKSLNQLLIANNKFTGEIPAEISGASSLGLIDLSINQFSGVIPATIGQLTNLSSLSLQTNSFTGQIPRSIGSCTKLDTVNLSENSLSGEIPESFGYLQSLNSLDLSNNQLSGQIPASFSSLKLSSLDLSNNQLIGQIPAALAINAYNGSFQGNPQLCSDSILNLKPCSSKLKTSSSKLRTILTSLLVGCTIILSAFGLFMYFKKHRSNHQETAKHIVSKDSWNLKSFRILTFDEQEIINSIARENQIGRGGSGNVYKVVLRCGKIVAVKHILHNHLNFSGDLNGTMAMLTRRSSSIHSREFDAEVNTLSAIRHVNVVKLYCSITSEDSSLLVYEYLPKGSLWDQLHGGVGEKVCLDWEKRYEIAVGSARGLEYLHHGCDRPILHRDVKSSNILLDEFFKPRIADFGLAKILQQSGVDRGRDSSSSHLIAGTYGYIAPEYAYTWKVSEKSDVYSFGVVLMELVTGRKPLEPEYGENKDIVHWITSKATSMERMVELLDGNIVSEAAREGAVKVLKIAVLCTARLPALRPSMRTVVQMLEDAGISQIIVEIDSKENMGKAKLETETSYRLS